MKSDFSSNGLLITVFWFLIRTIRNHQKEIGFCEKRFTVGIHWIQFRRKWRVEACWAVFMLSTVQWNILFETLFGIITFVNSTVNFTEISLVHTVNFTAIEHIENNDCSCSRRLLRAPCSSIMIVQSFRVNVWRHEQFIGKLGIRRLVLSFSLCFRLLSIRSAPKCSHFAINPFNRSLHSPVWVCWWDEHLSGQGDDRHCFVGRLFRRCVESLFIFCCPFAKCEWTSILAIIVISQILPWCHDTLSAYACGICLQYDQKRFPFRPSALHLAS